MARTARQPPDTEDLLDRAGTGDASARQQLFTRHRKRLRQMVTLRMDRRLAARIDPSDVVQELLITADQRLDDYLRRRPIPFYPWLRQLATDRLIDLQRLHLYAKRRSVSREEAGVLNLPDESAAKLAGCLVDSASDPARHMLKSELRSRVRQALDALAARDREILALRHLEELSTRDTAAVLGISESAAKLRHLRALKRLRELLDDPNQESKS